MCKKKKYAVVADGVETQQVPEDVLMERRPAFIAAAEKEHREKRQREKAIAMQEELLHKAKCHKIAADDRSGADDETRKLARGDDVVLPLTTARGNYPGKFQAHHQNIAI